MNTNMKNSVTRDEASVSRLAYQLWENAGRPAGRDLEFWLAAEAQLHAATTRHAIAPQPEVVLVKETSKPARSTKTGAKKTWPKPYPTLPKF
jgi:Protein of unknown function (DUF2934)